MMLRRVVLEGEPVSCLSAEQERRNARVLTIITATMTFLPPTVDRSFAIPQLYSRWVEMVEGQMVARCISVL